ncbi:MAG: alpha/beta hydrolase [Pseudomonadota bacterium]
MWTPVMLLIASTTIADAQAARAVAASPSALHQRTVHVEGLSLHVVEAGPIDAPALLLLHGFMVSSATYETLQKHLATRYRVIALDAPGHGQSSRPCRELDAVYQARVTLGVLDALGVDRVVIVGQSMGAMTGLALAARAPRRVRHLIAINPAGFDPGALRRMGMGLFVQESMYRSGPELAFWLTALGSSQDLGEPGLADLNEQLQLQRDPGWARSMASVYRSLRAGGGETLARQVTVPVTLVFGLQDAAYDESYRARIRATLPAARVVDVENCGHNVHHDAPQRLIEIVDETASRVGL